ncbi:MAG TPA: hypothetical protein VGV10_06355 [Thermoleophilaceae bacterium]|nr:hypothetical protein [Thermoleophilaceae bacterium]
MPHAIETYELRGSAAGTDFVYSGELGTDLWGLGGWWANRVAGPWERAVAQSIDGIQAEAERQARRRSARAAG